MVHPLEGPCLHSCILTSSDRFLFPTWNFYPWEEPPSWKVCQSLVFTNKPPYKAHYMSTSILFNLKQLWKKIPIKCKELYCLTHQDHLKWGITWPHLGIESRLVNFLMAPSRLKCAPKNFRLHGHILSFFEVPVYSPLGFTWLLKAPNFPSIVKPVNLFSKFSRE